MTTPGIPPPRRGRPWGRVEPGSKRWWRRYNALKAQGFNHDEAAQLSEGRIATRQMLKGRRTRVRWLKGAEAQGWTAAQIEKEIDDMYDEFDWYDAYTQFYPEGPEAGE